MFGECWITENLIFKHGESQNATLIAASLRQVVLRG